MSIQNISVGDVVPLNLLIVDGSIIQFPQVEIRDNDNNLLTTLDLVHTASGKYEPSIPYVMPNEIYLTAVFIVYSDSGHTVENTKYERDIEVFYKVDLETLVNNQVSDVLKVDTITEMSPSALPLSPTFEQVLNYLYRKLRNRNTANLNRDIVYADDDTTELFKAPLSDDSVLFTKSKYISGT